MKFSIIIPVYNVEKYLRECLDSVLAQTCTDWECVCIDDGSCDSSGHILDEYASRDSRFRVVHKPNEGVSIARNVGLELAQGLYIAFIDGDDSVAPRWLSAYDELFERTNADLCRVEFGWEASCSGALEPVGASKIDVIDTVDGRSRLYTNDKLYNWLWCQVVETGNVWGCAMKCQIAKSVRFEPGVAYCEDSLYLMQVAPLVKSGVQMLYNFYNYRIRRGSAMRSKFSSEERLRYARAIARIASEVSCANPQVVSRAAIGNVMVWAARPRDMQFRTELWNAFCDFHAHKVARSSDVKIKEKIPYYLYRFFGWIWPILLFNKIIAMLVVLKRKLRS